MQGLQDSYEDISGLFCSYGVCVDCIVQPEFFCADGERRSMDGDADEQTRRLWDHQQDGRNVPRTVTSYCVISCPLYVMDERTKKRSKK